MAVHDAGMGYTLCMKPEEVNILRDYHAACFGSKGKMIPVCRPH